MGAAAPAAKTWGRAILGTVEMKHFLDDIDAAIAEFKEVMPPAAAAAWNRDTATWTTNGTKRRSAAYIPAATPPGAAVIKPEQVTGCAEDRELRAAFARGGMSEGEIALSMAAVYEHRATELFDAHPTSAAALAAVAQGFRMTTDEYLATYHGGSRMAWDKAFREANPTG